MGQFDNQINCVLWCWAPEPKSCCTDSIVLSGMVTSLHVVPSSIEQTPQQRTDIKHRIEINCGLLSWVLNPMVFRKGFYWKIKRLEVEWKPKEKKKLWQAVSSEAIKNTAKILSPQVETVMDCLPFGSSKGSLETWAAEGMQRERERERESVGKWVIQTCKTQILSRIPPLRKQSAGSKRNNLGRPSLSAIG